MRDPRDLYELDPDIPELAGAVLLHQFDGFMDAGSAGRALTEHLLEEFEPRVIARFDVDRLIDYRSQRPPMTFASDHWEGIESPELAVRLLHDATGGWSAPVVVFIVNWVLIGIVGLFAARARIISAP